MSTSRRPISRKPLHAEVADELREMIIGGKLAPGLRLIENDLCAQFETSRTPFREALKVLETEGLVVLRPNHGARVSVMTASEVADLFELVANLERIAVELAIDRLTDKDLNKLRRMHGRMIKLSKAGRRRECFQVDYEIHQLIVSLTRNVQLIATHAGLMVRTRRGRYLALFSQARWDDSMTEHEDFMAAIEQRNADLAGQLMRKHVLETGAVVLEALHPTNLTTMTQATQVPA